MEQQKVALVEALARKGSAMCRIYTITNASHSKGESDAQEQLCTSASSTISLDSIDKVWRDVLRFTDTNDAKVCGSLYFVG
jgi:folylpolyglutamate synthase/dihydropteroate synthase